MLNLVVMRHAQTINNHPSQPVISSGIPGPAISPEGLPHAEAVASALRHRFDIVEVHTSPLRRAIETAELLDPSAAPASIVQPELIECDVGSLENKSSAADFDMLNQQLAQWLEPQGRSTRLGGTGDSGDDVRARFMKYLESLDWSRRGTIVAVSHALAMSSLMNLCGIDLGGRSQLSRRFPENCGWALLELQQGGLQVIDSDHW